MMRALAEYEDEVARRVRDAASVFCFLDFDGTLAPLAPTPDEARPLPGTEEVLRALATAPSTAVAIVTGRTIANLRRFLDVPGVHYAGAHGLEIEWPSGKKWLAPGAGLLRAVLPSIRQRLEQALAGRTGVLIEDKGAALACHYRLAAPADAVLTQRTLAAIAREYERRGVPVALLRGHAVIELRPAAVSKGEAVRTLLAACTRQPLAVYMGDDQTDVEAFHALPRDAITVHVGPADLPARARYSLPGPSEVQRFLRRLLSWRSAQYQ
jgi:trehalose 6-phosphate phosphatase